MMFWRGFGSRVHAGTVLVAVGFTCTAFGSLGWGFLHRVATQAGPNVFLAGLVFTIVEVRKTGWRQATLQFAAGVPWCLLPLHYT